MTLLHLLLHSQVMDALIFLTLFCFFTFQSSYATELRVHYPFHIKGHHHHHHHQPQYDNTLSCFELQRKDNNTTTIHFPSYGDLVVKSISYNTKKIELLDPRNCLHRVFLNLNLTLTPFHYYYVLKNVTYLNCSTSLQNNFIEVPCLSGLGYHVYTVDPSFPLPSSCKEIKTVAIPFKYSPYISDNSLGLRLTWNLRESEDNKQENLNTRRDSHTARNTTGNKFNSSISFFSFYLVRI